MTEPPRSPRQDLLFQLNQHLPSTLLFLSHQAPATAIEQWADDHQCAITFIPHDQNLSNNIDRHEFAVVADYLNHLDRKTAIQRLGQLRNLLSHRIWVMHFNTDAETKTKTKTKNSICNFNDFIGLGFQRLSQYTASTTDTNQWQLSDIKTDIPTTTIATCYGYDLANYNHKRTWNNSRHWANPENWNKYRW